MTMMPSFDAGKFGDDVADREFAFDRVGGKGVVFDLIAFQVVDNVALQFLVIFAAHVARAEGGDLAGVLEGASGVDVGERTGVGSGGHRSGRCGLFCRAIGGAAGGVGGVCSGAGYGARENDNQWQSKANS